MDLYLEETCKLSGIAQAAVAAAGVKLGGNVAKMEVREVESAFA
jgi:hypothetical protein